MSEAISFKTSKDILPTLEAIDLVLFQTVSERISARNKCPLGVKSKILNIYN